MPSMPKKSTIFVGKMLRRIARLRGGGSALPGLWVEKLEPHFLRDTLGSFEHGVVLISGTNGKTTTTKMISELLAAAGLKVFTNRTGSNFTRGVVSGLLESMELDGSLPFNIAVLELDEAHAVHFVKQVPPKVSLFLNVMRDQLDRFGEIDHTARLLKKVAEHTTHSVILNRDDRLIRGLAEVVKPEVRVRYFGAHKNLLHLFPGDELLRRKAAPSTSKAYTEQTKDDVELAAFKDQLIAFRVGQKLFKTTLKLSGYYNFLNAAAALATVRAVIPKAPVEALLKTLATTEPAFGRGERVMYHKQPIEFVLVKNPAGFRLALASAEAKAQHEATMIAVNDNFADGRDMSWLWDVDFSSLSGPGVQLVSGVRAYDMALRLQYDNVPVSTVEPQLAKAFKHLLTKHAGRPMRIYCTYTAMLKLRALAQKTLGMERTL